MIKRGLAHLAKHGLTSFHNMDGNLYQLQLFEAFEARGELTARARIPFHFKNFMEISALEKASEMSARYHSNRLASGFVKLFVDGVLDSWTAVMVEDYADRKGWVGEPLFSKKQFAKVAMAIDKRGLQIAVHAIGDGAVRIVLDGYEAARKANGPRDSRHRIEHIEVVHPDDIARFRELGVIASMQPPHPPGSQGLPLEPTVSRIGRERWPYSYAWNTLRDAGAHMVFATDWPVSDINPIRSIQSAITRTKWADDLPDQRQTLEQAIAGYTRDGAFTEFKEDRKGRLKHGMLADVTVLSGDLEKTDPERLHEITTDRYHYRRQGRLHGLTAGRGTPRSARSAGRMAAGGCHNPREESPGSMERRCRVTPGGGNPRDSATENRPPSLEVARVKRCGKSAPRARQRTRRW